MSNKKTIVKAIIATHIRNSIQGSLPIIILNKIADDIDLLYRYGQNDATQEDNET